MTNTRLTVPPTVAPSKAPRPSPTATPTPPLFLACATDHPRVDAIQPGGEGAPLATFAPRWGQGSGVASGHVAFGRYADTGRAQLLIPSFLPNNQRVWALQYFVDSTRQMTTTDADQLVLTLMPRDATPLTAEQRNGDAMQRFYCSAAMLAAFPEGTTMEGSPMPDSGILLVDYTLRVDGTVDAISVGYGGAWPPAGAG